MFTSGDKAIAVVVFIAGSVLGGWIGRGVGRLDMEEEAVDAGVATYYLNKEHHREWRWIKPKPKTKTKDKGHNKESK